MNDALYIIGVLAFLGGAIVWVARYRQSSLSDLPTPLPSASAAQNPLIRNESVQITGRGEYLIEVIGESNHRELLHDLAGGWHEDGCRIEKQAVLWTGAYHPDKLKKQVLVTIDGHRVGVLDNEDAKILRDWMQDAGHIGRLVVCNAIIVGGFPIEGAEHGLFGVKLDIPWEDSKEAT